MATMKRWLIFALVALALLVLVSPGLVGLIAERSIERQLEFAASQDSPVEVTTERFERGWFTSEGRHRVPLADPALIALLAFVTPEAGQPGPAPVLIINTKLDHGLVPVASVARDAAGLLPALANGVSTLELETADGRVLPVPGLLATRVGLTGSASFRYRLPPGRASRDGVDAEWLGADVTLETGSDGRHLGLDATIEGLEAGAGGRHASFGRLDAVGSAAATRYGFAVGELRVTLEEALLSENGDEERLRRARLELELSLDGERVSSALEMKLDGLDTPAGRFDLDLAASARKLDARVFGALLRGLERSAGAGAATGLESVELDFRRLLSAGAGAAISRFELATDEGRLSALVDAEVASADSLRGWPGILLATAASADVTVDRELVTGRFAEALRPLVAGGFLVPAGERFRMRAEFADGIATVNGAPLPVPVPGQSRP